MVFAPKMLVAYAFFAAAAMISYTDATPLGGEPVTIVDPADKQMCKSLVLGADPEEAMPVIPEPDVVCTKKNKVVEVTEDGKLGQVMDEYNRRLRNLAEETTDVLSRLQGALGSSNPINKKYNAYLSGKAKKTPWAGNYWPVYEDSINYEWNNEASAAEKYAKAFGLNVKSFLDGVSKNNGIDKYSNRAACSKDSDCDWLNDLSRCGKRTGQSTGRCIPRWWGVCHAWAPAAIAEEEPACPVTQNGVTFRAKDIKGLMTLVYDGAPVGTWFMGSRYNGDNNTPKDQYGSYIDLKRRDVGPALLHLAVGNLMGRLGRSFVADVDSGNSVWNQPVREYKIQELYSWTRSNFPSNFYGGGYPYNSQATKFKQMKMHFSYIDESTADGPTVSNGRVDLSTKTRVYDYLLELNDNDEVLGGEWLGNAREDHPDFIWVPANGGKPPAGTKTPIGLEYNKVLDLLTKSAKGDCNPVETAPAWGSCGTEGHGAMECPTGQYCQPWNPNQYQCIDNNQCGKPETGVDYNGNDIKTVFDLYPWECCDACRNTAGCKAYTFLNYVENGGKTACYLKSAVGPKQLNNRVISGTVGGSPPVTTTPAPNSCSTGTGGFCGNNSGFGCCKSGDYCQPWNPDFFQCRTVPSGCSKQETNVDYYGNDIKSASVKLPEECCDLCKKTSGCKAYTYVNYYPNGGSPQCYLKSSAGGRATLVGAVSGQVA